MFFQIIAYAIASSDRTSCYLKSTDCERLNFRRNYLKKDLSSRVTTNQSTNQVFISRWVDKVKYYKQAETRKRTVYECCKGWKQIKGNSCPNGAYFLKLFVLAFSSRI
jgi:hypothetical protein